MLPAVAGPSTIARRPGVGPAALLLAASLALADATLAEELAPAAVTPPSLQHFPDATLPAGTRPADVDVVLWLTIDATGVVTEAEVKDGAGEPWDGAALAVARDLRFSPATETKPDGTTAAIAVRVPFTYSFRKPPRRGPAPVASRPRRALEPAPGRYYVGLLAERGSRKPLAGVPVDLEDPRTGRTWQVLTDAEGRFEFHGLPPGKLKLSAADGEHKPIDKELEGVRPPAGERPPPDAEPERTWYMTPTDDARYRTVVRERRPKGAASEITLSDDEIRKIPGTLGDPTRVVATLPGVARSPFGLGYYIVRGANFENTGFFIDGHPVLYLYHLFGGPAVVHPELVGDLKFYPGGYPAQYGRYAAGAVTLNTKDPPDDRWHLMIEIDLLKASALFSVPFDDSKGEVTLSFRRSYYDLILPLIQEGLTIAYTDYQARVRYDIAPNLRFRLDILGAEDEVAFSQSEGAQASGVDLALGFHRGLMRLEWDADKTLRWTNSMIFQWDHNDNGFSATGQDDIALNITQWFVQLRSYADWKPQKGLKLQVGVDALFGEGSGDVNVPSLPPLTDPQPPTFDPIIRKTSVEGNALSVAPWIEADWEVVDGLRLIPGVRVNMDRFDSGDGDPRFNADPKLAVRWTLDDMWTLKAMGAMAHQWPSPQQVDDIWGDPDRPSVEGIQASLGLEWRWEDDWEVSLEGFYNHLTQLPGQDAGLTVEDDEGGEGDGEVAGIGTAFAAADVTGRAYGLEVLIRKRMGERYWGWISYTLSRAERTWPGQDWTLFDFDQTHVLNLAASVDLGNEWSVGARFSLSSGTLFEPVTDATYDADTDRYQPITAGRERLALYHRLDLRLDKTIRYETWLFEIYLDIQNVYNAANEEFPTYTFDYGSRIDGFFMPILPTIGIKAVF